jgi:D-alanyl-D-alanine dipeptidase
MKPRRETDLVLLSDLDPSLRIELKLAGRDNPLGRKFYRGNLAYLRYGTAQKVLAAHASLREKGLGLKIWSAYRPFAVQEQLFLVFGRNGDWISDPYEPTGKKTHVRAAAIDCTLVDEAGAELAMPTTYLDFIDSAERMKQSFNELPEEVLRNRKLLVDTMVAHGMEPYEEEWWHYQDTDWAEYPIIRSGAIAEVHEALLVEDLLWRDERSNEAW